MRFRYAPFGSAPSYDVDTAIGCDGMPPARLALSHWRGNATPPDLKRDLSTGIALAFARLDSAERARRFGPLETAANDHFDCDGLLSVFACLEPASALAREDALLAAARAGDFWVAPSRRAVAFDLLVSGFNDPDRSPLGADLRPLEDTDRDARAYEALLDRMPAALDDPWSVSRFFDDELATLETDLAWLLSGAAPIVRHASLDLAVLRLARAVDPRAANEAAACDRVLELREGDGGTYAELRFSAESWFDLPSQRRLPRPDLDALAARLRSSERGDGEWIAKPIDDPVPTLAFGARGTRGGVRDAAASPRPSSLAPDAIAGAVVAFLLEARP